MIIAFDIDGVFCWDKHEDWKKTKPRQEYIDYINELYDAGHQIHILTARGVKRGVVDESLKGTKLQLDKWGLKYHKLESKPFFDLFVEDKAVNSIDTLKKIIDKYEAWAKR